MKGHTHAYGEHVEVHEFAGRNTAQALSRLGKWLDQNGGVVHSITFCTRDGAPVYVYAADPVDEFAIHTGAPVWASLLWSAK